MTEKARTYDQGHETGYDEGYHDGRQEALEQLGDGIFLRLVALENFVHCLKKGDREETKRLVNSWLKEANSNMICVLPW